MCSSLRCAAAGDPTARSYVEAEADGEKDDLAEFGVNTPRGPRLGAIRFPLRLQVITAYYCTLRKHLYLHVGIRNDVGC